MPPNFGGDPAAWVANVRPFLVPNAETLRSDGPNALTSVAYARDFNEVKELGALTSTKRTADQTATAIFLAGQRARDLEPRLPRARDEPPARHRRQRPAVRDDKISPRPTARSAAGTTSTTGTSGGRSPQSAKPPRTATQRPRPTRTGCRCSTHPFPSPDSRWSRPASPTTQPATAASAGRPCMRSRPSSAPTRSPSPRSATNALPRPVRPGASTASPRRSRRSPTPASGPCRVRPKDPGADLR